MFVDATEPMSNGTTHIDIAAVACGERMDQAIVMMKSAAIMSSIHIAFHVFSDNVTLLRDKLDVEVRSIHSYQKPRNVFILTARQSNDLNVCLTNFSRISLHFFEYKLESQN